MGELNIYTLIMMVRGFSNEVTVNWLAAKLGISYSTLARCKNGVWPRSVTFDAMSGVFDECRDRFFGGDEAAIAESALGYLERQGIDATAFRSKLAAEGYEACMSDVITSAHLAPAREGKPENPAVASAPAAAAANRGGERLASAAAALPVAAILLIGLLNVPLGELFSWMAGNMAPFCAALLAIALSTLVAGAAIDSPIAWRAYRRDHPEARFSRRDFALVAKYGDTRRVVSGAGRFDLSLNHCVYQGLCNVLGALCSISLLAYLASLPGFMEFFRTHEWTEFFKVGVAVGFFVAYGHNRDLRAGAPLSDVGDARENPDVYLPTRVHVWANALHLVCTFSLVCILVLGMLAYSFADFRMQAPSLLVLWPFAQTMLFLWYSCLSPFAMRIQVTCVGAFAPGVIASSVGVALLTLVCYRPSWESAVIFLACLACFSATLAWERRHGPDYQTWFERGRKSGAYSLAVVVSVFLMLAIGAVTSTLL